LNLSPQEFKKTEHEVVDFATSITVPSIPGVPKLSADRIIDGGRAMTFYRELPTTSAGRRFKLHAKVVGVYDEGKLGSVVEIEQTLVDDESGEKYAKIVGNTFYMGQGNWGGPKG
jgi:peroxisomal enoyl-CoA hydratase 2